VAFLLTDTYAECHIEAPYADCHSADCCYAECRGAFVPHQPLLPRLEYATTKCSTHVDYFLTAKLLVL